MSTQPPNRLEELEKAFALFKQSSEAFERKYSAFEQDLRAHIDGLNHYVTMTYGIVQTQEIDIRAIKSILSEHTLVLAQMQEIDIKEIKSTLREQGKMLERVLLLLEPNS